MTRDLLFVFLGGGLGTAARFFFHLSFKEQTALQTLVPNLLGCFLIGLIFHFSHGWESHHKALLLIGFLGGLTTFSSYILYMGQGPLLTSNVIIYFLISNVFGLLAFFAGEKAGLSLVDLINT